MDEASYDTLLDVLYDAVQTPVHLERFLCCLAQNTGATAATMISTDPAYLQSNFAVTFGIPEHEVRRYEKEIWRIDEWRLGAERIGLAPGRVVRGHELVDDDTLLASEFYRLSLATFNIFHWCGVILNPSATQRFLLSVQRPRDAGRFPVSAVATIERLKPHVLRAARIMRTLAESATTERTLGTAMDSIPYGVIVLLGDGEIAVANSAARKILDAGDGLHLDAGRLRARRHIDDRRLQEMLAHLLDGTDMPSPIPALAVARGGESRPLSLLGAHVSALEFWLLEKAATAIVFVSDPDQTPLSPESALRTWYGLTRCESRLALALLGGGTLADAAGELRIAVTTARKYLRSIFRKTQTSRQSELVRVLLALPRSG